MMAGWQLDWRLTLKEAGVTSSEWQVYERLSLLRLLSGNRFSWGHVW
jgi:hypothetical protein